MVIELSELELVWPPRLFAAEAQALLAAGMDSEETLGWLLDEAFHGDVGLRLYKQDEAKAPLLLEGYAYNPVDLPPWEALATTRRIVALVNDLTARSEELRRYIPRRYYRARQAPVEVPAPLGIAEVKSQFAKAVAELASNGYFGRAFGSSCVDDADDPDANGQQQLSELLRENQTPGDDYVRLWSMHIRDGGDPSAAWSDGLFYDLVEAMHDLVARPRSRYWHDYGNEWDFADFARVASRTTRHSCRISQPPRDPARVSPSRLGGSGERHLGGRASDDSSSEASPAGGTRRPANDTRPTVVAGGHRRRAGPPGAPEARRGLMCRRCSARPPNRG